MLQEHWLLESNLDKLGNINNDFSFHGVSSMNNKVSQNILTGHIMEKDVVYIYNHLS